MSNVATPFEEGLLQEILGYPFHNSPFERDMTEEQLKELTEKYYKDVLEQILTKISQHIKKKQDENVFRMVEKYNVPPSSYQDLLDKGQDINFLNPKTLRTSLIRGGGTEKVHALFTAFSKVVEVEHEDHANLKRVQGFFNVYNSHNTNKGKFQFSNLFIGLGEKESYLTYFSRRYKKEPKEVQVEIVGNDKLLVTLRDENCYLAFYAFIGALAQPQIIQATFLYNNGLGHTLSGIAILQKVKSKKLFVNPGREKDNFDEISDDILSQNDKRTIQNFLGTRGQIIKPKLFTGTHSRQPIKFNFDDVKVFPGPNSKEALFYENAKQYVGKYYVFFNERFPSVDIRDKKKNEFYSTVGKGILDIYIDPDSGRFRCRMKTKKNRKNEIIVHDGYIVNDTLKSPSYLILNMYEQEIRHRFVNIILMKTGGDILLGSHNIMYSRVGELGAGSVVVVRVDNEKEFDDMEPDSLYPCAYHKKPLFDVIINYLSYNSNALLSPITHTKTLLKEFANLQYSGVYKMYSYNKNGVRVGIMKINKTGFVTHDGFSGGKKTKAFGYVTLVKSVMNILLKDTENQRTGFCSVKVGEVQPSNGISKHTRIRDREDVTIYVGAFSGVTRRGGQTPLASTIILEFVGNVSDAHNLHPQIIKYNQPGYSQVPQEIKDALGLKHQSFIGFIGARRGIYSLADLKEYNNENVLRKKNYMKALAYGSASDNGPSGRVRTNTERHGKIKDDLGLEKEELSRHFYERAVYHAVVKNNPEEALKLFFTSKNLTLSPAKMEEEFKKEIKDCECFQVILEKLEAPKQIQ